MSWSCVLGIGLNCDLLFRSIVHSVISSRDSGAAHLQEPLTTKIPSRIRLHDHFRTRQPLRTKLVSRKGMPASAASPIRVGSRETPPICDGTTVFAGMERHHKFPAAFQTLPLSHTHL